MTEARAPELPAAEIVAEGMPRSEWLAQRRKGLGGSDIAALLNISPWHSPASLFMDKRGDLEDVPDRQTSAQEWGIEFEEPIRGAFTRKTGVEVMRLPPVTMYRSKELPIALVSPDGITSDQGAFEAKTTSGFVADLWEDDHGMPAVPPMYEAQAQWTMAVTGLSHTEFGVLIGASDFRTLTVEADPLLHEMLFERASEFWKLVEAGTMPDIDGSSPSTEALKRRYAHAEPGKAVELGLELRRMVADWQARTEYRKIAQEMEDEAKNRIMLALADAEVGTCDGLPLVTWKEQPRRSVSVELLVKMHPELAPELVTNNPHRVLRKKG